MKDNIINLFKDNEDDMLDVDDWKWTDFRDAWKGIVETHKDEDAAWRAIYKIWQVRANEVAVEVDDDGNISINFEED
jgi:hypothetical protein